MCSSDLEGIATPDWRMVGSVADCERALVELGAPMIVKPSREGSSIGLTKVTDASQCAAAYAAAAQHDPEVLCEQFIEGEETTCPVLVVEGRTQALPVIRIVAPDGNYDYQNKYFTDDTKYHCPSGLPEAKEAELRAMLDAYRNAEEIVWAQEEPLNQGAWYQTRHYFVENMRGDQKLFVASRPASAAPAGGSTSLHNERQKRVIEMAFGKFK